jgi:hypothetical protein
VKKILAGVLFLCLAVGSYALGISVGVGAGLNFTSADLKGTVGGVSSDLNVHEMPITFLAFFDATYVQISAGYMFQNSTTVTSSGALSGSGTSNSWTYIDFSLYGKYPFVFGSFAIFPLLGIEYKLNLTVKDSSGKDLKSGMSSQGQSDLNELWFEGGVGADFSFGAFSIRPLVLIGFKPLSKSDNDYVSAAQSAGISGASLTWFTVNVDLLFGFKL